jgi:hypothetical protein
LAFERVVIGVAQNVTALPSISPAATIRRARVDEPSPAGTSGGEVVWDEAIDIHLGFDRATGHLAIVGGDVRIEPRLASSASGDESIGSLVNTVA